MNIEAPSDLKSKLGQKDLNVLSQVQLVSKRVEDLQNGNLPTIAEH